MSLHQQHQHHHQQHQERFSTDCHRFSVATTIAPDGVATENPQAMPITVFAVGVPEAVGKAKFMRATISQIPVHYVRCGAVVRLHERPKKKKRLTACQRRILTLCPPLLLDQT